jgi:restriction system protein
MIPKFHQTMLPILQCLSNGESKKLTDIVNNLLVVFKVTDEERRETIGNGTYKFDNRVGWGRSYLKQAGLIHNPERWFTQITTEGKKVLSENIPAITVVYLKKYDSFRRFITPNKKDRQEDLSDSPGNTILEEYSPFDQMDMGFHRHSENLRLELKDRLVDIDHYFFEKIIGQLFQKMGYGKFIETPKARDGGIDGILSGDALGIEKIYTQAKHYKADNLVGELDIRNFVWALMTNGVKKWIFVTTSDFREGAYKSASNAQGCTVILLNGTQLIDLMIEYSLWIQVKDTYVIKEIDNDFFMEDS